ncbi:hypothetical protein ACU5P1_04705 [Pseudomonas plecoglossicida]|uniref:hypothetical protein n=1 Tax=Pseudomonas plecoglossicida TaxID=70775 RepID=UPI0011829924|nr:hypothetical protein [Pseudomonas plecoglossicida]QLB54156.1 hypothetical protein HAV28_04665 [Pseudomonas plecoglossicida]
MPKPAGYRAKDRTLKAQLSQSSVVDSESQRNLELEFEEKLKDLMESYSKNLIDIIEIMEPASGFPQRKKNKKSK